jgi:hypothetical protein
MKILSGATMKKRDSKHSSIKLILNASQCLILPPGSSSKRSSSVVKKLNKQIKSKELTLQLKQNALFKELTAMTF